MSEANKLIDKILSEAKEIVQTEQKAAKVKAEDILKKAKKKIINNETQAKKDAETEAVERKRRIKSVYDLEHKKDILAMKRKVLDQAFERVVEDIVALKDKDYFGMMTNLLVDCTETGEGAIMVAKNDAKRLDASFLKQANDALKAKAGKGDVTLLTKTCDKKGGFIFMQEGMEMDCSVEAVVALAREQIETDAAAVLFKED